MERKVHLYALSTCGWCRRVKRFFEDNGIAYTCDDVDLLPDAERDALEEHVQQINPWGSYPTVVVDETEVVLGFDEDRLRALLGL
jgi:glutaredoxin-like protein NrdH